ncbi:HipA domain-containing protein [Variovorax sp. J31P207]|uniref:HipA domain-containing protein n=1 Tax=Variovorax sp. J31P207 TaxID=3053510 RepID=UPI002574C275|nr:HipA domain-containing protein [Variovorax sp. J31P207]MDM0066365.1 HipA domain-containing protein [Variovorax sp. J31P207]
MDGYILDVYAGGVRVGTLGHDQAQDTFQFTYDAAWRALPGRYPLSPHLPLEGGAAPHAIRRFLENLLPEGEALVVAANDARVARNNVFGLIRHLGHETAGALSFVAAGQVPAEQEPLRRQLPFEELQARIDNRANEPFNRWDGKVRMSIAGHQDKLLVAIDDGELFLVDGALSSTHILKPEPAREAAPCMVANEHFCMQLANRISMRRWKAPCAAQVNILRVPSPVLSIERFDRRRTPGGVERLHIIDGCQALDLSVSAKYERNVGEQPDVRHIRDGASFEKLGTLRPGFVQPALAMQRLVLWAVTTLLFGNSDSHGKNISFFADRTGLTPTPLYDLVSVVQYEAFHHDLAMAFGDEFELDAVLSFALADFCVRMSVDRKYFARELTRLCEFALQEAPAQAANPAYTGEEVAFVQKLARFVDTRARALLAMARDIPKFAADSF